MRFSPGLRPYLLLAGVILVLAAADRGRGNIVNPGLVRSTLQQFATMGPVALALGLSMVIREFDLSVAGMLGLGGCIAVLGGGIHPNLGLLLALAAGLVAGLAQAVAMVALRLGSIGVTLGGLLTLTGLSYVLTGGETVGYPRMDVAVQVNAAVLGPISLRTAVAMVMFAVAAAVMGWTRLGRDVVATGSDRRAAGLAGVATGRIILGVFAVSGALTGLAGGLLGYSLAAASPSGLSDALVPAIAACIIGGVSTAGGRGTPLGIAGGVLVLCALRAGLSAAGAPPYVQQIITGLVLLAVALADSRDLRQFAFRVRRAIGGHGQ